MTLLARARDPASCRQGRADQRRALPRPLAELPRPVPAGGGGPGTAYRHRSPGGAQAPGRFISSCSVARAKAELDKGFGLTFGILHSGTVSSLSG